MGIMNACTKEFGGVKEIPQKVVFEYRYLNNAFGQQFHGWIINDQGAVLGYENPEIWKFVNDEQFISEQNMEENYAKADTVLLEINYDDLVDNYSLIDKASQVELSEIEPTGIDMGTGVLYCYLWDKESRMYRQVFLGMNGNYRQRNTKKAAKELTEWLSDIGRKTDRFVW